MLKYYQLTSKWQNGSITYSTKEIIIVAANNGILWNGSYDHGTYTDMRVSKETSTYKIINNRYLFPSEADALSWVEKAKRDEIISQYKQTLWSIRSSTANKAAATRKHNELLDQKSKMETDYPYVVGMKEE